MSNFSGVPNWLKSQPVFLGILLTVFAFFTFFWSYTNPPYLYWDENYHIASAQKYLNGTFFMEPHPPLAKMLIAAGEAIFDANEGMDDEFIGTDYAKELPGGFSFQGYRFFPVLLGWLIAPLLYLIFLMITRKSLWAFILSFLYVFDNALVTH
ncbi:MAG: phospholipid carrier-dependent glycosyltransferase, partial [Candidatus Peribacter sp.]|nr:phospholipid carrier-dependent glycosyltransferase [Candidatus Peribacter sp.]